MFTVKLAHKGVASLGFDAQALALLARIAPGHMLDDSAAPEPAGGKEDHQGARIAIERLGAPAVGSERQPLN